MYKGHEMYDNYLSMGDAKDELERSDVMPIDKKDYPAGWDDISRRIRKERANDKCERRLWTTGKNVFR